MEDHFINSCHGLFKHTITYNGIIVDDSAHIINYIMRIIPYGLIVIISLKNPKFGNELFIRKEMEFKFCMFTLSAIFGDDLD